MHGDDDLKPEIIRRHQLGGNTIKIARSLSQTNEVVYQALVAADVRLRPSDQRWARPETRLHRACPTCACTEMVGNDNAVHQNRLQRKTQERSKQTAAAGLSPVGHPAGAVGRLAAWRAVSRTPI